MVRLLNSIRVEKADAVGIPMLAVRVLSAWGVWTGEDCDCLTTDLYIAVNEDGLEMAVYRLDTLLQPVVDSLVTERRQAVVYITYGEVNARHQIKVQPDVDTVRVDAVPKR